MSEDIQTKTKTGKTGRPKLNHTHVGVFLGEDDCNRLRRLSAAAGVNKSEFISRLLALADDLDSGLVKSGSGEKVSSECEDMLCKYGEEIQTYYGIGRVSEELHTEAREKFEGWQQRGRELGAKMKKKNA